MPAQGSPQERVYVGECSVSSARAGGRDMHLPTTPIRAADIAAGLAHEVEIPSTLGGPGGGQSVHNPLWA
jgi:hypothetical protein